MVWGDNDCKHEWVQEIIEHDNLRFRGEHSIVGNEKNPDIHTGKRIENSVCVKCGAVKCAFGLEDTPEDYVSHTIEFLRAIRRVLRKDGVVFWDIGDSYVGGGVNKPYTGWAIHSKLNREGIFFQKPIVGKPKDLCLIPFRVAIAAQQDGWFVRSVIIWNKLNPLPESCRDRPTESHEYIIMLTKSSHYYWDMEAVREKYQPDSLRPSKRNVNNPKGMDRQGVDDWLENKSTGRNLRSVWTFSTESFGVEMCKACGKVYESAEYQRLPEIGRKERLKPVNGYKDGFRSIAYVDNELDKDESPTMIKKICHCGRSDWLSHFATFPRALPEKCILAATSEKGNCSKCGKPWVRIIEKGDIVKGEWGHNQPVIGKHTESKESRGEFMSRYPSGCHYENKTLGWQAQCQCDIPAEPAIVLDPFAGSGTVGEVAKSLGRKCILIDLSAEYCKLAQKRVENIPLPMILT